MVPCQRQLCVLRPEFVNLAIEDQAALILACRIADAESYRICQARHERLREFIESAP